MNTFSISPCTAVIDLDAIRHNYEICAGLGQMMPVIKSDAYGHGMLPVAEVLNAAGARDFAVGTVDEARALRDAGFTQFITCLLGAHSPEEMSAAYKIGATPLITDFDTLEMAAACADTEKPFRIGIKCDTGMTRLGFGPADIPALLDRLAGMPMLEPVLALSHFACSDMPEEEEYTRMQGRIFAEMTDALKARFPHMRRSLANSAATLAYPEYRYELCRPGIVLYGGNPFYRTEKESLGSELRWAMSLKTPVLQVREIDGGTSVGYGRLFKAEKPARVAVVAAGYADGVSRAASGKGSLVLHGIAAPQIGRVCMGMMMVDISHIPDVRPGDDAWFMGGPRNEVQAPSPQEIADRQGDIPYVVMCLLGRNTRKYIR